MVHEEQVDFPISVIRKGGRDQGGGETKIVPIFIGREKEKLTGRELLLLMLTWTTTTTMMNSDEASRHGCVFELL